MILFCSALICFDLRTKTAFTIINLNNYCATVFKANNKGWGISHSPLSQFRDFRPGIGIDNGHFRGIDAR
jgi:hypothetical protein